MSDVSLQSAYNRFMDMKIKEIKDITKHIRNQNGFIFGNRDGYNFIDCTSKEKYHIDYPIRHECRGIKFSPEGKTIARPLHKFFKVKSSAIELKNIFKQQIPYEVTEKTCGVMLHAVTVYNAVVLMSRRGRTQIAVEAEQLLSDHVTKQCRLWLDKGRTPIFLFSPGKASKKGLNKHPRLTLIALRRTIEGNYLSLENTKKAAEKMKLPCIDKIMSKQKNPLDLIQDMKLTKNSKGLIIRFKNNLWIDITYSDNLDKDSVANDITSEKDILKLVLNNRLETILPHLPQSKKNGY